MQKILIVLALAFSVSVLAAPKKYSDCRINVEEPDSAGSYFFDEDCKTIYVTPPAVGRTETKLVSQSANLKSVCDQMSKNADEALDLTEQDEEASKALLKVDPAGPDALKALTEFEKNRAAHLRREDELDEQNAKIGGGEAGVVEFRFYSDRQRSVERYQKANPQLKVVPLPFKTVTIAITSKDEKDVKPERQEAVISSHLEKSEFHEGVSARVRLSYFGMCAVNSETDFRAYNAANLIYTYEIEGETLTGTEAL